MNWKVLGIVAILGVGALFAAGMLLQSAGGHLENKASVETAPESSPPIVDTAPPVPVIENPPAPARQVMVEVQGAVASPGVYKLPPDSRVFDALEKAGGALESAEIRDLNIAAALLDGSVVSIPFRAQGKGAAPPGAADLNPPAYTRSGWSEGVTQPAPSASAGPAAAAQAGKININTATQAELETLPGVGAKTAEKIISFRQSQPFTQVDDLRYVQGIGEKRMETLRPHVTVD